MTPWTTLLADEWEGIGDEYGPHGHAVWSAIELLGALRWFEAVGRPLEGDEAAGVAVVSGWERACAIFGDDPRYDLNGQLGAAVDRVWPVTQAPAHATHWLAARRRAEDFYDYSPFIPKTLPPLTQDLLWEHLYAFVSLLLAEIIGGDAVGSTYFREQLQWYCAGRFPCGLEPGAAGRMRVF